MLVDISVLFFASPFFRLYLERTMKKKFPSLSSQQRIARALHGLRETPDGGLILDEQSLQEDIYTNVRTPATKTSKARKTARAS